MNPTTAQEVFDQAYKGILAQGRASRVSSGDCFYRLKLEDGTVLKCAAGQLLQDDEYNPVMDTVDENGSAVGNGWEILWRKGLTPNRLDPFKFLICSIQFAHDNVPIYINDPAEFIERFKARMIVFAIINGLKIPS